MKKRLLKKHRGLLAAVLTLGLLLTGCAGAAGTPTPPPETEEPSPAPTPDVTPGPSPTPDATPAPLAGETAAGAYTLTDRDLALIDLLAESGGNTVVSSLSVDMALSLVLEGARGETMRQLEAYLGVSQAEAAGVNAAILEDFARWADSEDVQIAAANSLWYQQGQALRQAYLDTLSDSYQAECAAVDFADGKTAERINRWCSEKTNGLISEIVDADAIRGLQDVLVNALYFKASWLNPFGDAYDGLFDGKSARMMDGGAELYAENDRAVAFAKRYFGGYAFIGVLPREEGDFTLGELDIPGLVESLSSQYDVSVTVPKLDVEFSARLPEALRALGVADLFDDRSDLSGMADDLYVSDILHKTVLKLDEIGTEAAAVTAIAVATAMAPAPKEHKTVVLDRPFAFVLYDFTTGTALFTGKITAV